MITRINLLEQIAQRAPAFPVFVYGPPGWGKTTHGARFAEHFGKTRIIDGWHPRDPLPPGNALVLTQHLPPPLAHAVPIADALRLICGTRDPRDTRETIDG